MSSEIVPQLRNGVTFLMCVVNLWTTIRVNPVVLDTNSQNDKIISQAGGVRWLET